MPLAERFASIFDAPAAREKLSQFGRHVPLPTFNLTATSLRHLNMWFDRLNDISRGAVRQHGNFFSDPAAVGLVDNNVRPRVLTRAGQAFLALRSSLRNDEYRAEYELLKILYFTEGVATPSAQSFLNSKRQYLSLVLTQFSPAPTRHLFLDHPKLLVLAELVANFDGAIQRLVSLSEDDLIDIKRLGENGFTTLCSGPGFPNGLDALCRRIGAGYTRAEVRRLHYLISMCLLTISEELPRQGAARLVIPTPYCNLLTEADIYNRHIRYTSDISIWFDSVDFQISTSLALRPGAPAVPILRPVSLQPQTGLPGGRGRAPPTDASRRAHRAAKHATVLIVLDPVMSERAEDLAEATILPPRFGDNLVRFGHRSRENIALPDGMVPGADFYVIDQGTSDPVEFIEIKSVTGRIPFDISLTRAEYLRARQCAEVGLSYSLILVDIATGLFYEETNFAHTLSRLEMGEVIQITIRLGQPSVRATAA